MTGELGSKKSYRKSPINNKTMKSDQKPNERETLSTPTPKFDNKSNQLRQEEKAKYFVDIIHSNNTKI